MYKILKAIGTSTKGVIDHLKYQHKISLKHSESTVDDENDLFRGSSNKYSLVEALMDLIAVGELTLRQDYKF